MQRALRATGLAVSAIALMTMSCWKVDADLQLSSSELNFGTGKETATVTVTNDSHDKLLTSGVNALDYEFKSDRAWATVAPADGHLDGGQTLSHTVSIDRSALADGKNVATISVTSNGGNATIAVTAFSGTGDCSGAPSAPSNPTPRNNADNVSVAPTLSWQGGASQCEPLEATYDVYFGTGSSPPFHHNNGRSKSWEPPTLSVNTTYYWKVVAKDANGSTSGATWKFRTGGRTTCTDGPAAPGSLSPSDGAQNVALGQDLSWSGGESRCDGLTATYDVYFGTSSPPPFDHNNGSSKSWNPGSLGPDRTYYWRVVAKDANGSASSAEYSFRTAQACTDDITTPCNPSPKDKAKDVNTRTNLSWKCGSEYENTDCESTVTYVVYFAQHESLTEDDIVGTTHKRSFNLPRLEGNRTYYWRIVVRSGNQTKTSATWEFKTR